MASDLLGCPTHRQGARRASDATVSAHDVDSRINPRRRGLLERVSAGRRCTPIVSQRDRVRSTQSAPPGAYEGFLDSVSCDRLRGWAWTPSQPASSLTIDLYDGDRLLATTNADHLREDLREVGKGDGRHGFEHPIPLAIKDGKPHSIRAVVKDTSFVLPSAGAPSSVTCVP